MHNVGADLRLLSDLKDKFSQFLQLRFFFSRPTEKQLSIAEEFREKMEGICCVTKQTVLCGLVSWHNNNIGLRLLSRAFNRDSLDVFGRCWIINSAQYTFLLQSDCI